jgi:hypothetical protein
MKKFIVLALSVVALSSCRDKTTDPVDHSDSTFVPTEGLVAYYAFNGNANDQSGNNFHGDVSGAVLTTDRFGNANKAYKFDGLDDYIAVANTSNSKLEPKNEITLSCFIYADAAHGSNEWSRIIRKEDSFDNGYVLSWDHEMNGMLQYFLLSDCVPAQYYTRADRATMSNAHLVGEWHHLAMTYSKSTKSMKVYIDGVLASVTNNCLYDFQHSDDVLFIGGTSGKQGVGRVLYETFPGKIDDVRIYERALNKSEIHALYHEGGFGM